LRLAILGYGNVTKALLPILAEDSRFEVAGIHSRSRPGAPTFEQFLCECNADVLVELTTLNPLTGEPAISHIRAAFARGMHVVTANKGPIANAYADLAKDAADRRVGLRFESSVMDGAPVFNQFRNNLPGVKVLGFAGVLNSTSNLIIERMEHGGSFEDGVRYAQRLGVAEADATYDIEGWDSAAKTATLANVLLDARTNPQRVERQGIEQLSGEYIRALAQEGKTVRLVSRGRRRSDGGLRLTVNPEVLPRTDVLAIGEGTSNVLLFETDKMGVLGTVSISPGVEQTAYGAYIDLVSLLERV
jgi:homoserine dehydrogenase